MLRVLEGHYETSMNKMKARPALVPSANQHMTGEQCKFWYISVIFQGSQLY
jgi:hypothetical protein